MKLAIFGAQGYALGTYEALKTLYSTRVVDYFLVSSIGNNARMLGNIPVRELAVASGEISAKEKDEIEIIIATPENVQPEYADYIPEVLKQKYFYNYNVILAKKNILREYCEWLFPILERTEKLSVPKGRERADRYIGYMEETLETLYFMKNADRLNIVHAECKLFM